MRTPIIAGNWKMHKTVKEAVSFVREIRAGLNAMTGVDSVVCPPYVALPEVSAALQGTDVGVGAQNMHFEESGAYTGECAPGMIAPYCQYVILGHSERRAYYNETDEAVNKKVKAALRHGLTPIVCVGETLDQNEAGETHDFVSGQVQAAFSELTAAQVMNCIIAYEPIWAIGTGKSASPADAGRIIGVTVRGAIADAFGEDAAANIRIQYGGSAKPANIGDFMQHPDIDGALVGGASLTAGFVEMVRISAEAKGIR
ncbi:MAG: triose-phosphate isomerase [Candidatus Promineifilaceae bacterium]|nr:triose-phosphate isomerase [Candidatus Promineifilaceae bacterium]